MKLFMALALVFLVAASCSSRAPAPEAPGAAEELLQLQMNLAVGYLRHGDHDRAREKLNRALEIAPDHAPAHAAYGLLFQAEGETELAEKFFRDAIHHNPADSQARNSYGAFLFSEKRYHDAVKQFEKASEDLFYVNRPVIFENLGKTYRKIGDLEGAEYAFTRTIQLDATRTDAILGLADIKFDRRNYTEARTLYGRYSRMAPSNAQSLWLCVRLSRIFKSHNEEASCGEALEGIFPDSEEYKLYKHYKESG